jgi:hypothetical protein
MSNRKRVTSYFLIFLNLLLSLYLSRELFSEKMTCFQDCNYYGVFKSTYIVYTAVLISTFILNVTLFVIGKWQSNLGKVILVLFVLLMALNFLELLKLPIKSYLDYAFITGGQMI